MRAEELDERRCRAQAYVQLRAARRPPRVDGANPLLLCRRRFVHDVSYLILVVIAFAGIYALANSTSNMTRLSYVPRSHFIRILRILGLVNACDFQVSKVLDVVAWYVRVCMRLLGPLF